MRVIDPGHVYSLHKLDDTDGSSGDILWFVKRVGDKYPGNDTSFSGTTSQEVIRALIDRAKYVDNQIPFAENTIVLACLRQALWMLEARAARCHGRLLKAHVDDIETQPICTVCGHIECQEHAPKEKV